MQQLITVNYIRAKRGWKFIVTDKTQERKGTTTAASIVTARDRADQLVKQISLKDEKSTVVHLLDGDAFAFTSSYWHTRLGLPEPGSAPATGSSPAEAATQAAVEAS